MPIGLLKPGDKKTLYTYVTPRSTSNIGRYDLRLVITSDAETETIEHEVIVRDCYDYTIEAIDKELHVCPCEDTRFDFEEKYSEVYYWDSQIS